MCVKPGVLIIMREIDLNKFVSTFVLKEFVLKRRECDWLFDGFAKYDGVRDPTIYH